MTQKPKTKKTPGWAIALSIIVGIPMFAYFIYDTVQNSDSDNSSPVSSSMAYTMSKQFVEKNLKSPRTAKFAKLWDDGVEVQSAGANRWHVESWVDAQNSFGAMIRNHYSCDMIYVGDNTWRCRNLEFE